MSEFRFTADIVFDAVDIDDALEKLYHHFGLLMCGVTDHESWFIGEMSVKKAKE